MAFSRRENGVLSRHPQFVIPENTPNGAPPSCHPPTFARSMNRATIRHDTPMCPGGCAIPKSCRVQRTQRKQLAKLEFLVIAIGACVASKNTYEHVDPTKEEDVKEDICEAEKPQSHFVGYDCSVRVTFFIQERNHCVPNTHQTKNGH